MIKPIIEGTKTVVVKASDLTVVLGSTIPFAAHPEGGLPSIAAVQLHAGGDVLTATATDRYCLAYARTAAESSEPVRFVVHVEDAKRLRARLSESMKRRESGSFLVVISIDDRDKRTMTVDFEPYSFAFIEAPTSGAPDLVSVLEKNRIDPETTPAAGPIGISGTTLRPFVKAAKWAYLQPMRWTHAGPEKPVVVEISDWFLGLIMPVRLPADPKAVDCVDPAPAEPQSEEIENAEVALR